VFTDVFCSFVQRFKSDRSVEVRGTICASFLQLNNEKLSFYHKLFCVRMIFATAVTNF